VAYSMAFALRGLASLSSRLSTWKQGYKIVTVANNFERERGLRLVSFFQSARQWSKCRSISKYRV
jgi:hypothetical protein